MEEPILNNDQAAAALAIKFWFMDQTSTKQCFTLAGYAGTGKTFLINYLIKNLLNLEENEVAFVAPTGKAASVLIQKGNKATTIHKLIYNVVEKERVVVIGDSEVKTKKIEFVKKSSIPNYKLIIVDEVSMVEKSVFEDLLSFGIPILCCGDSGQLRPIGATNGMLDHPDAVLSQIVRQSLENPIIQIATKARMGLPISCANLGDVIITQEGRYTEDAFTKLLLKADIIICGTNIRRNKINSLIRKAKGYSGKLPELGEKIICNVNNWEVELDKNGDYNLVNGIISTVNSFEVVNKEEHLGKISITPDFLNEETADLICDTGIFTENKFMYDMHQRALLMENGEYKVKRFISARGKDESKEDYRNRIISVVMDSKHAEDDMQINRFEYAYAITAHKSQGSEWNNVVVFDDSGIFGVDRKNWLYTAITRAKKKLVIIK